MKIVDMRVTIFDADVDEKKKLVQTTLPFMGNKWAFKRRCCFADTRDFVVYLRGTGAVVWGIFLRFQKIFALRLLMKRHISACFACAI